MTTLAEEPRAQPEESISVALVGGQLYVRRDVDGRMFTEAELAAALRVNDDDESKVAA